MTVAEMHISFRFGMDKLDSLNYPNFEPEEIDLLLNQGQERFIKQRYGITNTKRTSFEETEKRTEDLKEILLQAVITPTANSTQVNNGFNITTNSVFCTLPSNHWFTIWERAIINSDRCNTTSITLYIPESIIEQCRACPTCDLDSCPDDRVETVIPASTEVVTGKWAEVRPIQHLEFSKIIKDPFKGPDYDKVLRLMYGDSAEIIPATYSTIVRYVLRYVKKPATISLSTPTNCELSEHAHQEVVDEAIKIALEGIEAKRTNTFTPIIDNQKE